MLGKEPFLQRGEALYACGKQRLGFFRSDGFSIGIARIEVSEPGLITFADSMVFDDVEWERVRFARDVLT
jgi:hypothetical protein